MLEHQRWSNSWVFLIKICLFSVVVVLLVVVLNFSHFCLSQEPLGLFQPNLAQSMLAWWRNEGSLPFPRGDNNEIVKTHWGNLIQIHIQTWHKAFLGKGYSSLFKMKGHALCQGEENDDIVKILWLNFKNLFLQNHCANFNQTWHKTSLDEKDLNFFNEGLCLFSRGDNNKMAKIIDKIKFVPI